MMADLKKGDRVVCKDGSWSFGIENGNYVGGEWLYPVAKALQKEGLLVIATDLDVRRGEGAGPCDTLLTNENGGLWFVQSSQCEKWTGPIHIITIDGKSIELSDESFENLKKQLV